MNKYCVIITRDITESALVRIEADSPEDAELKVMDTCGRYGQHIDGWNVDDNCFSEVYITGVDQVEERDDDEESM